ncbi:MAG: chemotaxis response regulator protein-glutamate methylesterase, partial [Xanthobacteraceae bacterium]
MSTVLAAASPALRTANPLRVMVVDDAIVVRSLLARWVDAEPDMEV